MSRLYFWCIFARTFYNILIIIAILQCITIILVYSAMIDKKKFVQLFAEQFFEIEPQYIRPTTEFRDLAEWSDMHGALIRSMIETEYNIHLSAEDLKECSKVNDVYQIVSNKLEKRTLREQGLLGKSKESGEDDDYDYDEEEDEDIDL